ncbi:MAG: hypothetical protein K8S25_16040 [Alphaproteobacteria bacterium]|nr:hypothetical protein [Alphaproteobacteria bacterium]
MTANAAAQVGDRVTNMQHSVGASGTVRLWAAVGAVASGLVLAAVAVAPAHAYSGAQAEAQSDPVSNAYDFPNIKLCCDKPRYKKPRRHRHGGGYDDPDYPGYPPERGTVRVSCGEPVRYSYSSIAEALDEVGEGGRIRVLPGAACDISGLTFDQGVTIESEDNYGGRAELRSSDCATVAPSYSTSTVSLRGVDVDGCLKVERGRLDLVEVNLASRGAGDAVRINGGTFSATNTTIRARGTAVNAARAVMVSISGGGFASGARADQVFLLNADGANLQNTLIKGALVGVRIGMQGRYPVTMSRVQVLRGEASEIYQIGPGKAGVVVGGAGPGDDLPSLPNLPGVSFSIDGGVIAGYVDGLVFTAGTRGSAKGVNIAYPGRGIVVDAGAAVELRDNKITHAKRVGIDLASGAVGSASLNDIQCDDGACVCYGGECTSRSDKDFGKGAFRMSGTRCDD